MGGCKEEKGRDLWKYPLSVKNGSLPKLGAHRGEDWKGRGIPGPQKPRSAGSRKRGKCNGRLRRGDSSREHTCKEEYSRVGGS